MAWLPLLFSFLAAFAAAIVSAFLSVAWRRKRKPSQDVSRLTSLLPGHDCGFCGRETCSGYAAAIDAGADPALCAPGGERTQEALRSLLSERRGDPRALRMRAIVRCGGNADSSKQAFDYDNREDCASAAALYGGPKRCKEGCLGFGSCASACPLGAITMERGLAVVDAERCSGCGACVPACPKGLIALVPASETWYVACSSRLEPESRTQACSAACEACGECARRSTLNEFSLSSGLARANRVEAGRGADIAAACPRGAIRSAVTPEKKAETPIERSSPKL